MAVPTQPLGLSATYLALLQARQSSPAPAGVTANPSPRQASAAAPTAAPSATGRGRFIDIIA